MRKDVALLYTLLPASQRYIVEPYAGGASISLHLVSNGYTEGAILNDLDSEVANFWRVVFSSQSNAQLQRLIRSSQDGSSFNREFFNSLPEDDVERAFLYLVKNRVSRGGVVAPGSGFLNKGEDGKGLLSRWYPETLCKRLAALHNLRFKFSVHSEEAQDIIKSDLPDCLLFIDPPYTTSAASPGTRLYTYSSTDLAVLLNLLSIQKYPWLLTEHHDPIITKMVGSYKIALMESTIRNAHNRDTKEFTLISSHFNLDSIDELSKLRITSQNDLTVYTSELVDNRSG